MDTREQVLELLGSMQRDLLPSLVRMHEEDDLQILHAAMLQVLDRGDDPTVKEMASLIRRSESRTSRVVEQLVRRGLAERYEDDADRRVRRVRISEEGTALLRRLRTLRVDAQTELWKHLSADEQQVVLHALELYAKAARRFRDERDRSR